MSLGKNSKLCFPFGCSVTNFYPLVTELGISLNISTEESTWKYQLLAWSLIKL